MAGPTLLEIRQGRRRLKQSLPSARAAAQQCTTGPTACSAIAEAMLPYVSERRLEALVIYPAPLGGWHADLTFKNIPHGVANVLGTPVDNPLPTRAMALEAGRNLLEMALVACAQNLANTASQETPPPAFILCGLVVHLDPELYERLERAAPNLLKPLASAEQAIEFLADFLARYAPEGVTLDTIQNLAPSAKRLLYIILHGAVLHGVFRYPPIRDAPPMAES